MLLNVLTGGKQTFEAALHLESICIFSHFILDCISRELLFSIDQYGTPFHVFEGKTSLSIYFVVSVFVTFHKSTFFKTSKTVIFSFCFFSPRFSCYREGNTFFKNIFFYLMLHVMTYKKGKGSVVVTNSFWQNNSLLSNAFTKG